MLPLSFPSMISIYWHSLTYIPILQLHVSNLIRNCFLVFTTLFCVDSHSCNKFTIRRFQFFKFCEHSPRHHDMISFVNVVLECIATKTSRPVHYLYLIAPFWYSLENFCIWWCFLCVQISFENWKAKETLTICNFDRKPQIHVRILISNVGYFRNQAGSALRKPRPWILWPSTKPTGRLTFCGFPAKPNGSFTSLQTSVTNSIVFVPDFSSSVSQPSPNGHARKLQCACVSSQLPAHICHWNYTR